MSLSEKCVMVTGGVGVIGKAICESLLMKGCKVAALDVTGTEDGNARVEELATLTKNSDIVFIECDVTNDADFENAFIQVKSLYGHADILVNCAGHNDERKWQSVVNVNFTGTVRGCMNAFKSLEDKNGKKGGTVLNVASLICYGMGGDSLDGFRASIPVYAATKHGIVSFTRSWSDSLNYKDTNVKVMAICPDGVRDDFSHNGCLYSYSPELAATLKDYPCLQPSDVAAEVVRMLEEDKNGAICSVSNIVGSKSMKFAPFPD